MHLVLGSRSERGEARRAPTKRVIIKVEFSIYHLLPVMVRRWHCLRSPDPSLAAVRLYDAPLPRNRSNRSGQPIACSCSGKYRSGERSGYWLNSFLLNICIQGSVLKRCSHRHSIMVCISFLVFWGLRPSAAHLAVSLSLCSSGSNFEPSQGPIKGAGSTQNAVHGSVTEWGSC